MTLMRTYDFQPDYTNIVDCAWNRVPKRLPLYEHIICFETLERIVGKKFAHLIQGNYADKVEFFRNFCEGYRLFGYDTVSFEVCMGGFLPGSGALGAHKPGVIKTREDFERYPWDEVKASYFSYAADCFNALNEALPAGMKAVGGVGNGVFEAVQDIVGYIPLCFMSEDDPELFSDLFDKMGELSFSLWSEFMAKYSDAYCVLRFGDDLGFKSNTLISADDIKTHIIPRYKKIIDLVHSYGKPFLFHSCGCIFNVMDDLIDAGINAKHSNEDQIAPFPVWVEKYGDKIGNFGGIDTDAVCRLGREEMKDYITEVVAKCQGHGGFAFGSGNSIPNYVPFDNFMTMNEIIRGFRKE